MIYFTSPDIYPTPDKCIEEITYFDENDIEWKISRVVNGFFVKYCGHPHFKDDTIWIEMSSTDHIKIRNTGCIFIQNPDFEVFAEIRNIIKIGYTDDIWDSFVEFLKVRFQNDRGMIESEII